MQCKEILKFVDVFIYIQVEDYTGTYNITLVPCLLPVNKPYSLDTPCDPQPPVSFSLPVYFQQISDPVPTEYTLNTDLTLTRKRDQWLSKETRKFRPNLGTAFAPGKLFILKFEVNVDIYLRIF